jgi:hypothetical protein
VDNRSSGCGTDEAAAAAAVGGISSTGIGGGGYGSVIDAFGELQGSIESQ